MVASKKSSYYDKCWQGVLTVIACPVHLHGSFPQMPAITSEHYSRHTHCRVPRSSLLRKSRLLVKEIRMKMQPRQMEIMLVSMRTMHTYKERRMLSSNPELMLLNFRRGCMRFTMPTLPWRRDLRRGSGKSHVMKGFESSIKGQNFKCRRHNFVLSLWHCICFRVNQSIFCNVIMPWAIFVLQIYSNCEVEWPLGPHISDEILLLVVTFLGVNSTDLCGTVCPLVSTIQQCCLSVGFSWTYIWLTTKVV